MTPAQEKSVVVGIAVVVILVVVLAVVIPGPTADAAAVVRGAPPATPQTGDHIATLESDRELFPHTEDAIADANPLRKLPRGQRVKVVDAYLSTRAGKRLHRVFTMTGTTVDAGENTRGYAYLSAAELA